MLKAGKPGPVTVAKAYRLLRTICETAVADELIARNPCSVKGASVEHSPERPIATVATVAALEKSIEPRYRAMVSLAAWCGLRLGELLALTRDDIDMEAGTVRIDKAALELSSGERVIGPPKTQAGRRSVTIPPHVLAAIIEHLGEFTPLGPSGLVFVGTLAQPVRRASFYKSWSQATSAVGVAGLHFHDLRHTGATLAASVGASTRELMARLGHASPSAALRYQHATADRDRVIAEGLSGLADANHEVGRGVGRP